MGVGSHEGTADYIRLTMHKTILPTKDERGRRVYEWLITDVDGSFLAGGYCRTKIDAHEDMNLWLKENTTHETKNNR